jgi:hypothetical protein
MRLAASLLGLLFLATTVVQPQSSRGLRPPGITDGQRQIDQPLEPPLEQRSHEFNLDQVNAETRELRRLADGLPPQIDQVAKGQLPKDLAENLKKIEKLAKHIRGEITP